MPLAINSATALPASRTVLKLAMMQRAIPGFGVNLTVTSSVMASIPSEPTTKGRVSSPGESKVSEPNVMGSPFIKNPLTLSTLCKVSPYFKQCTPPEFSATLPPIVQAIWLEGSGA